MSVVLVDQVPSTNCNNLVLNPSCQRVDWVVTHWRCDFLLAYKGYKRSKHSQIYVGDIAKDLAMRE